MDVRYTRVWARRYGHGMHEWLELTPRYICMYATAMLCLFVLHLLVSYPLLVLVCPPAVLLVARCPGPCQAVARSRLSAHCAGRCPCLSVQPLLMPP